MNGVVHGLRGGNKFLRGGGVKIATLRAQNVKIYPPPPPRKSLYMPLDIKNGSRLQYALLCLKYAKYVKNRSTKKLSI